ncbi:iron-containing alcohol dehydrogenase [Bordetella sp. BOR01]|uniref:iron-containing alcohol dehydrogenase n=1 Tax=Bordetella sp. BOR01 TaxID=2854779 RepID=UPI001C471707|nr:iron-containing alcohol dehydrogenase [Bordetella sp. BOR01]MBV7481692.1 iron-containing alcohol dehydrogenase [Bordetella sp. BOR01]
MLDFGFNSTRSIVVEYGGAARLADRIAEMGYRNVLMVTDPGVVKAGLLDPVLAGFTKRPELRVVTFSDVQADPPEEVILAAAAAARGHSADCVVGFGGGSSLDAAKLAALLAGSGEALSSIYGVNQARGPRLPLILVPTTAGTGSEATPISIVTTGEGEKKGVVSPSLLPDLALLDAELTLGLPTPITAATGIDAMVHAIEAYTSKRLKNPISDAFACESLRLMSTSLHKACRMGSDRQARENLMLGACMAGMAFANAPVAAIHALAYPVGARFHVPHGLSNALMLGPVLRFNQEAALPLYAKLQDVVRPGTTGSEAQRASAFCAYMARLSGELGLPVRLRDVGIQESDVPQLAADAMNQTRLLVNNMRELTLADAHALYAEAL